MGSGFFFFLLLFFDVFFLRVPGGFVVFVFFKEIWNGAVFGLAWRVE